MIYKETPNSSYLKALSRRARDLYNEISTTQAERGARLKLKAFERLKQAVIAQLAAYEALEKAYEWELVEEQDDVQETQTRPEETRP